MSKVTRRKERLQGAKDNNKGKTNLLKEIWKNSPIWLGEFVI